MRTNTDIAQLPVSVIVLAHQNDKTLGECLAALNFSQEIVVLDNNSGADWQTYSQNQALIVIPFPEKIIDFAQARNFAAQRATYDWVLFIDSDEVIQSVDIQAMQECMKQKDSSGFITRTDTFLGKVLRHGEVGAVRLIRFYNRQHAAFTRPVHEVVEPAAHPVDLHLAVQHYSHRSLNEFIATVNRYALLEATFRIQESRTITSLRLTFELICFPFFKFLYNYLLQLGILDGWRGFAYAVIMSLHSALVRIHWHEQSHKD